MKIKYPYTKPQSPTNFNSKSHPSHFCTKLWSKTIWCMEGRRGHLRFHKFSRRFVNRWHLTRQCTKTWSKVSEYRRSQNLYSINCGQDGYVYKTNTCVSIHSYYTLPWCCVFLKHKIQCWPNCFLHTLNCNTFWVY